MSEGRVTKRPSLYCLKPSFTSGEPKGVTEATLRPLSVRGGLEGVGGEDVQPHPVVLMGGHAPGLGFHEGAAGTVDGLAVGAEPLAHSG